MSQHHIEDLVEESARLVLSSDKEIDDKKRLIKGLLDFQDLFDTSDTLGRIENELRDIGYFDDRARPEPPALLALVAAMMAEAERQDLLKLAHHWLAMLIGGLDEGELADALPPTFAELAGDADAAAIRDIAIRHQLARMRPRHGYVALRPWTQLKPYQPPSAPAEIERLAVLRYFADLKTAVPVIERERDKALALSANRSQSPFHRLPELGALPDGLSFVKKTDDDERTAFVFALDRISAQDDSRIYFKIQHDGDLGIVVGEFWIVSETLLRWQKPGASAEGTPVHFTYNYFFLAPDDQAGTGSSIHPMGGWKYRLGQSQKVLTSRLAEMVSLWPKSAPLLAFHRTSLAKRLLEEEFDEALKNRVRLADTFGFFRTEIELLFAHACLLLESGDDMAAILGRIEQALQALSPQNQRRAMWQEGLERLRAGTVWFPPDLAGISASCRV